jgi:hypothetical protein
MINNETINYSREKKKKQVAILSLTERKGKWDNGQKRHQTSNCEEFFTAPTACHCRQPRYTNDVHATIATSPKNDYHGTSVLLWSHWLEERIHIPDFLDERILSEAASGALTEASSVGIPSVPKNDQ